MRRALTAAGRRSSPWRRRAQRANGWRSRAVSAPPMPSRARTVAFMRLSDRDWDAARELGDERRVIRGRGDTAALEAMRGDRRENRLHIFRHDEFAARDHRPRTRRAQQTLTGARRQAEQDVG